MLDAIAFNVNPQQWPNYRARRLHAAYKLDVNHYRGRSRLQLILQGMQADESALVTPSINYAAVD